MQLPREITVRIRPDGQVEFETSGFVGHSCVELAEFLERLVDADGDAGRILRELKPEYYLAEQRASEVEEEER